MSVTQLAQRNWGLAAGMLAGLGLSFFHARGALMGWLQFLAALLCVFFGCVLDSYRWKLVALGALIHPMAQEGIK